ncbi:MAG: peptidoglycan-binding domain-containing protein [bacterium]
MKKLFLIVVIVIALFAHGASAAPISVTFTVNSNLDSSDAQINSICDDGAGNCTLRAAIEESNANSGTVDTINFATGMTITPTAGYAITDRVIIDASSVGTCPVPTVFINGANSGNYALGLNSGSAGSIIKGLWINGYNSAGIAINNISGTQTVLSCNVIGLSSDGLSASGANNSISIAESSNILIGGPNPEDRNTLSGNQTQPFSEAIGIGNSSTPMTDIVFRGNYFGTNISGTAPVANGSSQGEGIDIYSNTDISNILIRDNLFLGGAITVNDARDVVVQSNTVNIASDGITPIAATDSGGFSFTDVENLTVGGIGEGNVFAASGSEAAIKLRGGNHATIKGNFFGVLPDGVTTLLSGGFGDGAVRIINGARDVTVGGTLSGEGNLILNDALALGSFLWIISSEQVNIFGNTMGIDNNGNILPIDTIGVFIVGSEQVAFGGLLAGQGNTIAGNSRGMYMIGNAVGDVTIAGNTFRDIASIGIISTNSPFAPGVNNYASILQNTFSNVGTAIDLAEDLDGDFISETQFGATLNDAGDADTGPNDYLNTPIIHGIDTATGMVTYSVDAPAGTYRIEFFVGPSVGKPEEYLGSDVFVSAGVSKQQTVTFADVTHLSPGALLTATTIQDLGAGSYGATSEFSQAYEPLPVVATQTSSSGKGTPWTPVTPPKPVSSNACPVDQQLTQNLKIGARNGKYNTYTKVVVTEAKILQTHMNRLGFSAGPVDGILGKLTDAAIKRMQKYLGTYQDGIVGPLTRNLINNSCGAHGLSQS